MTEENPQFSARHSQPIRVMVLEDDPYGRAGVEALIHVDAGIEVVVNSEDPEAVITRAIAESPDVVVVDLRIGGEDEAGIAAMHAIRKANARVRFIVLSGHLTPRKFMKCVSAGARVIVQKLGGTTPLIHELIRIVCAGGTHFDADMIDQLLPFVDMKRLPSDEGEIDSTELLTDREMSVLIELANGKSNAQIAEALVIAPNTVKTHLEHIFRKLGVHSKEEVMVVAITRGLLSGKHS